MAAGSTHFVSGGSGGRADGASVDGGGGGGGGSGSAGGGGGDGSVRPVLRPVLPVHTGWQIDSFGHSGLTARVLAELGFVRVLSRAPSKHAEQCSTEHC